VSEVEETSAKVVVEARERLKDRQRAALSEVHLFSPPSWDLSGE
jgi:hypothetical protein